MYTIEPTFTDRRGVLTHIIRTIEASGVAEATEYDLDYIADNAYDFNGKEFYCTVDATAFWELVEEAAF